MKKHFSILTVLMLAFLFTACNPSNKDVNTQDVTTGETQIVENQTADEPTIDDQTNTTEEEVIKKGTKGEGLYTITTPVFSATVPEGVKYKVYSYYVSEDGEHATITVDLTPNGKHDRYRFNITNQGMDDSYERAIEHAIELENLDTYDEGKYELGEEVEYAGIKYQTVHTSTKLKANDFIVGYEGGWTIKMEADIEDKLFIDSPEVVNFMSSLSVVPLED